VGPLISVTDLSFRYTEAAVLKSLCFDIFKGEICAIIGPNGSGKSTLMNCLNGFFTPQSGSVFVSGQNIKSFRVQERARRIAFVSQEQINSFPYQVIDMVVMGRTPFLDFFNRPSRFDYEMSWEVLNNLGLAELGHRPFTSLSGGEKQLVRLARAFVQTSEILLLDEPTVHLDIKNTYQMLNALSDHVLQKDKTIVASIHDPNLVLDFAQTVIMINNGEILEWGPVDQVMTSDNLSRLYHVRLNTEKVNGSTVITYPRPAHKY